MAFIKSYSRRHPVRYRSSIAIAVVLTFLSVLGQNAFGDDAIVIQVRPGQTIRDVSAEYLGNPNLWRSILEYNGLKDPSKVVPWMRLRVPVSGLALATVSINKARTEATMANRAGARLFAAALLDRSTNALVRAREAFQGMDYTTAIQYAETAIKLARQARKISNSSSNISVKAFLEGIRGIVQTQRPGELTWKNATQRMGLVEGERVRTLRKSSAEIVFRDNSRVRLGSNSLMVIRELRQDVLRGRQSSTVALMQGDVVAYLSELRRTNRFELAIPGIRTDVRSRSFWVNRDANKTTRLAVYDGHIGVASAGDSVVVQANQGTTVRHRRPPTQPRKLLPTPVVRAPADGKTLYNRYPTLRWRPVRGAAAYRLEIARDRRMMNIAEQIPKLLQTSHRPRGLPRGVYFWRVSAVDSLDLPSPPSTPRSFVMQFDRIPPFIVVTYPHKLLSYTSVPSMPIGGEIESGAVITVNGKPISLSAGEEFRYVAELLSGKNRFSFTARDSGGNRTTVVRTIVRQETAPDVEVLGIESDELSFVTREPFFTMNGRTEPGAHMTIWRVRERRAGDSLGVPIRTDGRFTFSFRLDPGTSAYLLEAVDRAGNRRQKVMRLTFDNVPPDLRLETPLYVTTRSDSIHLTGTVESDAMLLINRQAVAVSDGRFSARYRVPEGKHNFIVTAEDDAGNKSEVRMSALRDTRAPRLVRRSVRPRKVHGGEIITIRIRARDDRSKLRRTARYRVVGPGRFFREGILIATPGGKGYSGRFLVPRGVRGTLRLAWVTLGDTNGNSRRYSFRR